VKRHVTRWLLALYPRAWRDRYGAEVLSLTDELIRAGETTPLPAGLNLVAGAAVERARALAESRSALLVSSAAVIVALAGGAYAVTGSARPDPAPRSLASSNCLMAPAIHASLSAVPAARRPPTALPRFSNRLTVRRLRLVGRPSAVARSAVVVSRLRVLRPALIRPVRPLAPRSLRVTAGSCLRPPMIQALISGRARTLRVRPPVPAATRVTR
jgi:hypothetical protein